MNRIVIISVLICLCLCAAGCQSNVTVSITENGFAMSDLLLHMGVSVDVVDEKGTIVYQDNFTETESLSIHKWSLPSGVYTAIAKSPGHSSEAVTPFRCGLGRSEVVLNFKEIIIASRVTIDNETPPPGIREDVEVNIYAFDNLNGDNSRKIYTTGIEEDGHFYAVIPPNTYCNPQVNVVIGDTQYFKPGFVDMYDRSNRFLYDFNMPIGLDSK